MFTSVEVRSALAFAVLHGGQVSASLAIAASYFSLAPFPPTGSDSHSSSSNASPFTPASAALMWHFSTAWTYFVIAFATPSSHFPTPAAGGTQPPSSPPKGAPGQAMTASRPATSTDATSDASLRR